VNTDRRADNSVYCVKDDMIRPPADAGGEVSGCLLECTVPLISGQTEEAQA